MNQQFDEAKSLAKKITSFCHQINTDIVFYALIDTLAGLVISHIETQHVEAISQEAMDIFMAQVKNYQALKPTMKLKQRRRRRKRTQTVH